MSSAASLAQSQQGAEQGRSPLVPLSIAAEVVVPPPDTGLKAWLFLFGCFMLEALVWGFAFTFGVWVNSPNLLPSLSLTHDVQVPGILHDP